MKSVFRQRVSYIHLAFLVCVLVVPASLSAQERGTSTVTGTVVTPDGRPVEGATVYPDGVETDDQGRFHLERTARVISVADFGKERFQPRSIIVSAGLNDVRIVVDNSMGSLMAPLCRALRPGEEYVSDSGKYGIKFIASRHDVNIKRGKVDVDYVKHTITTKKGKSLLEFWFGPLAISIQPEDETLIDSASFHERYIAIPNERGSIGIDSWGVLKNGRYWRQTIGAGLGGAVYRSATKDDAKVFDAIMNSICFVPYPAE